MSPKRERSERSVLSAFRLPPDLIERLDRHVERMQQETQWRRVSRADALRALLTEALEAHEAKRRK